MEAALLVLDNWICWTILALGLVTYQVLMVCILQLRSNDCHSANTWLDTLPILISTLPLLGLLGTIAGLLETFHSMSVNGGLDQSSVLSGGIADALITTQLGLVVAIPAWLLLGYVKKLRLSHLVTLVVSPKEA